MIKSFFKMFSLFVMISLAGCATLQSDTVNPKQACVAWQSYIARTAAAEKNTGPFRIHANLRYSTSEQSTRVSALLWGNGELGSPYPLRLDLIAGVGNIVAKIKEDENSFLAYTPDQNAAYYHPRDQRTLVSFGVPIPLALSDLVLLVTGRSGALFLPAETTVVSAVPADYKKTETGYSFGVPYSTLGGFIELTENGTLLSWRQYRDSGWCIEFTPEGKNPLQPKRLRITHPEGYLAIIVVKEIEHISSPYTPKQLDLLLPGGVALKPLEEQVL